MVKFIIEILKNEKLDINNEQQYQETKNKQRLQILDTCIRREFNQFDAELIINKCNFSYIDQENKFQIKANAFLSLEDKKKEQLEQIIKSIYGSNIDINNDYLN